MSSVKAGIQIQITLIPLSFRHAVYIKPTQVKGVKHLPATPAREMQANVTDFPIKTHATQH
jgi:hypothetical protein